ncbi:MAG: pilus assembly protein [Parvularculaceae bacterium]|nr:pilus assembly protein [Parvularculaceae bacterium]
MMRSRKSFVLDFARDRHGVAATEFALILPLLIAIFFGMLEISDAMMAGRRVQTAVNSMADLIAQERDITTAEIDDIMVGVNRMLSPTSGSTTNLRVTSVVVNPAVPGQLIVRWSRDNTGATPYAANSVFTKIADTTIVNSGASLIVGEVTYNHVSGLTHMFIDAPRAMSQTVTRWPRRSAEVVICGGAPLPACVD